MGRTLDIDISGTTEVGPELNKDKGDHVMWSSDHDCTIIFNHTEGTPFDETHFQIVGGDPGVDSGPPTNGDKGASYRYSIYTGIIPKLQTPLPTGSPKIRIKP